MLWLEAVIALLLFSYFAYVRIPLWLWTLLIGIWSAGIQYFFPPPQSIVVVFWIVFAVIALVLNVPLLRRYIITARLLSFAKKQLPVISQTEQAALDAGDIWWEAKLMRGMPKWSTLDSFQDDKLTAAEQSFLDNQVNEFCALLNTWEIDREKDLPKAAWDYIRKEKFFGMLIPEAYGGLGFSAYAQSCIVTKIATRNLSAAVTVMVPNSLGPAELLLHYGTQAQKDQYLNRLAVADDIPCFALTAPEAGSDAGAIPDKGIVCEDMHDGKKVLGIRLTWNKRYITLAPIATVLGLAFKLYDPDNMLGQGTNLGITVCLIPTSHPGVETGRRHLPANASFMNGTTTGHDVFIPMDWVIGGVERVGHGWKMLMECLAAGRGVSLPALSCAFSTHAYQTSGAYAKIRQQFKCPIGLFEGVQEALGAIGGNTYLIEAARRLTTCGIDSGANPAVATAIAKYHMTELSRESLNHAMDIHAGKAIIEGPNNYISTYYHGVPVAITVEGANILTRSLIIFGQGVIRCHPYVLDEVQGLQHEDKKQGLMQFDKALFGHIGYVISNTIRSFILGLSDGRLALHVSNNDRVLKRYLQRMSRMSTALAFLADVALLTLGGNLKRKESLSARLGDVLGNLYLASAVVRYYRAQPNKAGDINYLNWALSTCLYRMEHALSGFLENFPSRILAKVCRLIIFPFGLRYKPPADKWTHGIAESMISKSNIRERLTTIHHNDSSLACPVAYLESAFVMQKEIEPILAKLKQAKKNGQLQATTHDEQIAEAKKLNVLSAHEVKSLASFEALRLKVINVDEFELNHFGPINSKE